MERIHPKTERVSQLRILYVDCFRMWSFQKTRNVVCLELYTEEKYYLQLNTGERKFAGVPDSFCVMVQLWCLLLTLNSRARRSTQRLESSCCICVMGLSLPSYSHFHISQSPVEFYGAAGKNKKQKTFEDCRGETDKSGYLSLPTVTLLPPGEHPEHGRNQGKGLMGECLCHFLSVYKSRSLLEKHTKSTSDIPWFFFLHSSSFSSSALPSSLCQIFKVCNEAVVIYSSLPFCPSDSGPSRHSILHPFLLSYVKEKTPICSRCYPRNMTKKLKNKSSSCVLNQDGHN